MKRGQGMKKKKKLSKQQQLITELGKRLSDAATIVYDCQEDMASLTVDWDQVFHDLFSEIHKVRRALLRRGSASLRPSVNRFKRFKKIN